MLVLAACATPDPELKAARESWRGATYDEVVARWGPPARSVKDGGRENHTWVSEDRPIGSGGGGAGGVIFAPPSEAGGCERTIVFRNARAVDERWSGAAEVCKRFARRR